MLNKNKNDRIDLQRALNQRAYVNSMNAYRQPRTSRFAQEKARTRGLSWPKLIMVLVIVLSGYFIWTQPKATAHAVLGVAKHLTGADARAAAQKAAAAQAAKAAEDQANLQFSGQVNAILTSNPGIAFSISIVTPVTGPHHYGSSGPLLAGSTTKVLTAAAYMHNVEIGQARLNQKIDGRTAQSLLRAMIVNSDDTAWSDINYYLSYDDIQNYAKSIGLNSYDWGPNAIASDDIASLLRQLYNGSLLNPADRSLLLSWLKQANYRDFIVPAVPREDVIYHKVGLYDDNVNDAAIITRGHQWLVLVIFTDGHGAENWLNRARLMQQITRYALNDYLPAASSSE
ncbi:MAG TPA: serine hydrolase [Candidatus Saccharimonadales bacterium]|nr:serine hydrolase [Candidatus Saccharimonadales bacterium]